MICSFCSGRHGGFEPADSRTAGLGAEKNQCRSMILISRIISNRENGLSPAVCTQTGRHRLRSPASD